MTKLKYLLGLIITSLLIGLVIYLFVTSFKRDLTWQYILIYALYSFIIAFLYEAFKDFKRKLTEKKTDDTQDNTNQ